MNTTASNAFSSLVRARRSTRAYISTPVPDDVILSALQDAQFSPSNCNTQPWSVHVVSGKKRDELSAALLAAEQRNHFTPDFSFDMNAFHGRYAERKNEQAGTYYEVLGVARGDSEGRRAAAALNYKFFNAPHVALLFMPTFGDNVRAAADIGMYGQTLLLSLAAHGVSSIPQTALGFFAGTVREVLNIPDDLKMMFGISFGYPDDSSPANSKRMGRDPVASSVNFYS